MLSKKNKKMCCCCCGVNKTPAKVKRSWGLAKRLDGKQQKGRSKKSK